MEFIDYIKRIAPYPLIITLVYVLLHLLGRARESGRPAQDVGFTGLARFKPSRIWFILSLFAYGFAILPLYALFSVNDREAGAYIFFGMLSLFLLAGVSGGLFQIIRMEILVDEEKLILCSWKRREIPLCEVNMVYVSTGYIVIECLDGARQVFPAILRNTPRLIELVRLRSAWAKSHL